LWINKGSIFWAKIPISNKLSQYQVRYGYQKRAISARVEEFVVNGIEECLQNTATFLNHDEFEEYW
jgi:hypothetical protein